MPTTADLRALLVADADEVANEPPSYAVAIRRGRRTRVRRRVGLTVTALVAAGAIALPVVLLDRPVERDPQTGPTTGATAVPGLPPGGGWVADLPGLDLPVGQPLRTAYAVADVVVVGSRTYELGGSAVGSLLQVPEGIVVVSMVAGTDALYDLRLMVDDGSTVRFEPIDTGAIGDVHASVDPEGRLPTRLAWKAIGDQSDNELRSVVLGDPTSLSSISGQFGSIEGFLDGDVVTTIDRTEQQTVSLVRWAPGTDVTEDVGVLPDGTDVLAAARPGRNADLAVMFSGTTPWCTFAVPLTDPSSQLWSVCGGGPAVIDPIGALGATQLGAFDVATGEPVSTFDLGPDQIHQWEPWSFEPGGDIGIDARVVGWSGDDAVVQLSYAIPSSTTPDDGGGWTVNPWYVFVRCGATTGHCERLPHPVDVLDGYRW